MKTTKAIEAQNKELIKRWIRETDKRNYDAWDEVCSPDYVCHFAGAPGPMTLDEHREATRLAMAAFPDFKTEFNDIVAESDKVVWRVSPSGTHKGEFMGIPPTGKKIKYTAMMVVRIKEGKVAEAWGVADSLGLMEQLGMELKPTSFS
jgi:predicted ester cyclase